MRDRAARTRTGLTAKHQPASLEQDTRVRVDLAHLRGFEGKARSLRFLPAQPAGSVLNGRHASRLRGRGLNFEELRGYLPGDDPRTIDWKVTARTGKAHVRVYSEERDRPVLLVVDQRMTMFFGTRLNMKSVTAAEAAALTAFRVLDQGDRVGGLVFGDDYVAEVRPKRSQTARDQFLSTLVKANQELSANNPGTEDPQTLNRVLGMVARAAPRNHLVVVFSDFDGIDRSSERLVGQISRHNDLILCPVTDPISSEIPKDLKVVVSDGDLQVELDTTSKDTHARLSEFATGRLAGVLLWQHKFGVPVMPLSSGEDTVTQIRHLTGLAPQNRRSRR
ncbi:MAG: DUF58 domain-containing protein [Roseibium sp.]|uniref:DUF58 domain-containing protein n=1 Tax=Roseibium sp. TaxID=1936156 RepID=UPI001B0D73C1|nr:DUF58 domain-containing protein [Roseibium sp.]MBO6895429.1 DUF58 domain-containing protein [Roseibium sp.]MBO6929991.1 DUF58 domain-containing protein [Roseibium sp.]